MQQLIAKLKPVYSDLKNMGLHEFMKGNDFIVLCNHLELTDTYFTAFNEVEQREKDIYSFLGDFTPYEDVLANFMNHLYEKGNGIFFKGLVGIMEGFLPQSAFIGDGASLLRGLISIGIADDYYQRIALTIERENFNYLKKATVLKNAAISRSQGGAPQEENYDLARKALLQNETLKVHIPDFIVDNSSIYGFWQFIKHHLSSYYERKVFLEEAFEPLLNAAIGSLPATHHELIATVTREVDERYVSEAWNKALGRMKEDPEGAITSARTLMETVFKHILFTNGITFDDALDLNKLYKLVANTLQLSPDQHTQPIFKQILGGCQTVIEGLGGLRNKLSDSHGKTSHKVKPASRHSELAVNLSGSICSFLLQTLKHHKDKEMK